MAAMPIHERLGLSQRPENFRRQKALNGDGPQIEDEKIIAPLMCLGFLSVKLKPEQCAFAIVTEEHAFAGYAEMLGLCEIEQRLEMIAAALQDRDIAGEHEGARFRGCRKAGHQLGVIAAGGHTVQRIIGIAEICRTLGTVRR